MKKILEKLEQADEILSRELNNYIVRPRKVKEARDLIQQALDEFEEMVLQKCTSTGEGVVYSLVEPPHEQLL